MEERFGHVEAHFYPWVSEFRVLMNHLKENDDRDELIFIDRARGIRRAQEQLEQEVGEELSLRRFIDEMKARAGYSINLSDLSYMNYAIDVLLAVMPEALMAGTGRPVVKQIKRVHEAAKGSQSTTYPLKTSIRFFWNCSDGTMTKVST